ncbi:hypothetical protein EG329_012058 [Mollisiaceae sp. DMI_Dod_QoI]|nr:hypothetical protein EG329_012058 [Helotiales sp. DMI_Dod_QoI]
MKFSLLATGAAAAFAEMSNAAPVSINPDTHTASNKTRLSKDLPSILAPISKITNLDELHQSNNTLAARDIQCGTGSHCLNESGHRSYAELSRPHFQKSDSMDLFINYTQPTNDTKIEHKRHHSNRNKTAKSVSFSDESIPQQSMKPGFKVFKLHYTNHSNGVEDLNHPPNEAEVATEKHLFNSTFEMKLPSKMFWGMVSDKKEIMFCTDANKDEYLAATDGNNTKDAGEESTLSEDGTDASEQEFGTLFDLAAVIFAYKWRNSTLLWVCH